MASSHGVGSAAGPRRAKTQPSRIYGIG